MRKYLIIFGLLFTGSLFAQVSEVAFPKPSYFKKHFGTAPTKVEIQNPVRLGDYVVDGKLELSLKSYLDLVMANNTDIAITKLSVETTRNSIVGALGLFDPTATANFNSTRRQSPSNDVTQGASVLNSLSQPFGLTVTQNVVTGGSYSVAYNGNKSSSNAGTRSYNPSYSSGMSFNVTQPLLRGRGSYYTKMPITIARSQLRKSEYSLQDSVMALLVSAENAYWNMAQAREQLRVAEEALKLFDTALKRAKREVELGATSPLDIFQNERDFANAELSLSQAKFTIQQREDAVRKQIGADLDPQFRDTPIVLTENVETPPLPPIDKEELVTKALARRPDLSASRQSLDIDDLNIRKANNGLLPNLSFTAQYGSNGTGGTLYKRTNVVLGDNTTSNITQVIPGGIGDALNQAFAFTYPTYGFGLTLTLPIRDRVSAAALANALVAKKQDALTVRTNEQSARLAVLQAISMVESSKASVELAKVAVDFAQKTLDAEQKKYDLGTSTMFFVLQQNQGLVSAQGQLVTALINYRLNVVNLYRVTGELLEHHNIVVQP